MVTTPPAKRPPSETVRITIIHPDRKILTTVIVPANVSIKRLVRALVPRLDLPAVNELGFPVGYTLLRVLENQEIAVEQDLTLHEAGCQDGDTFYLRQDSFTENLHKLLKELTVEKTLEKTLLPSGTVLAADLLKELTVEKISESVAVAQLPTGGVAAAAITAASLPGTLVAVAQLPTGGVAEQESPTEEKRAEESADQVRDAGSTPPQVDLTPAARALLVREIQLVMQGNVNSVVNVLKTEPVSDDAKPQEPEGSLRVKPNLGLPALDSQYHCNVFMIMPFRSTELNEIYQEIIIEAVAEMGLTIRRGDDFHSPQGEIMKEVWNALNCCEIVIADGTALMIDGHKQVNGNVYYELGLADVLGRPAILITQDLNDVPFDLRHRRWIVYKDSGPGGRKLQRDLKEAIQKLSSHDAGEA